MHPFLQNLNAHLASFSPFAHKKVVIGGDFFTQKEAFLSVFIAELTQTAKHLAEQKQPEYAALYADKLLKQFDSLNKAVEKIKQTEKGDDENNRHRHHHSPTQPTFHSSYRFAKNPHRLPPEKRLFEYRQALRVLNEKISWLIELQLNTQNSLEKQRYQQVIAETEYRKTKCLNAIDELEEALLFKRS